MFLFIHKMFPMSKSKLRYRIFHQIRVRVYIFVEIVFLRETFFLNSSKIYICDLFSRAILILISSYLLGILCQRHFSAEQTQNTPIRKLLFNQKLLLNFKIEFICRCSKNISTLNDNNNKIYDMIIILFIA